ncbi:MAG: MBL fold metallo-hydrolase [Candidatus Omnitrophica bacterium]|nr:MBL fold metallo-hydrolase [Candidatus Omnitrophota bacterium]
MVLDHLKITSLVENSTRRAGLLAEHGLSFWVECDRMRILFDTGQGRVFLSNAQSLQIAISSMNALVISHGHYDHAGGLTAALHAAPNIAVYLHPAALHPKYSRKQGESQGRLISPPELSNNTISRLTPALHFSKKPTPLCRGVLLTGEIPRRNDFEAPSDIFFLDKEGTQPDPLLDDQAMILETRRGVVVVVGCAHSGIVNILQYASELTGASSFYAVMGGFHLGGVSSDRLSKTIDAFRRFNVQRIGLGHCTGIDAVVAFWNAFPRQCFICSAGETFSIGENPD